MRMLSVYVDMGGEPEDFWNSALIEIRAHARGFKRRHIRERDNIVWQAHTLASLMRAKKIPPLSVVMRRASAKDEREIITAAERARGMTALRSIAMRLPKERLRD